MDTSTPERRDAYESNSLSDGGPSYRRHRLLFHADALSQLLSNLLIQPWTRSRDFCPINHADGPSAYPPTSSVLQARGTESTISPT